MELSVISHHSSSCFFASWTLSAQAWPDSSGHLRLQWRGSLSCLVSLPVCGSTWINSTWELEQEARADWSPNQMNNIVLPCIWISLYNFPVSFINSTLFEVHKGFVTRGYVKCRHFIGDKTEVQNSEDIWPRSHGDKRRGDLDLLTPIETLFPLPSSPPAPSPHPETTDSHQPTAFLWRIGIVPSLFSYCSHNIYKRNATGQNNLRKTISVYLQFQSWLFYITLCKGILKTCC